MTAALPLFAEEAFYTILILLLFGFCGISLVVLLKPAIPFPLLAAPLAGLLLVNTTTLPIYLVFHVAFHIALMVAIGLTLLASAILFLANSFHVRAVKAAVALALLVLTSIGFTWLSEAATIQLGSPALTYFDGTDHGGYANVAQWMSTQISWPAVDVPNLGGPRADPQVPYESLPNILLSGDPRQGAFSYLAIISVLEGLPSAFAYDSACSIFLVAAILGVSAVFARTLPLLLISVVGLTVCGWYDLSHAGYFGKMTAFPSNLFLIGLLLQSRTDARTSTLLALSVVTAASALMLNGVITAMTLAVFCLPVTLLESLRDRRVDWQSLSRLGICVFVALLTSGFFVFAVFGWVFGQVVESLYAASRALDLEGWAASPGLGPSTLVVMVAASALWGGVAGYLAIRLRRFDAAALCLMPVVLLLVLLVFRVNMELLELTGILYPAILLGTISLLSDPKLHATPALAFLCLLGLALMIAMRVPRAVAAAARYSGSTAVENSYTKDEFDRVAEAIGARTALVDVGGSLHASILVLIELGRRELPVRLTEGTWALAIGNWRAWKAPQFERPADLKVILVKDLGGATPLYAGRHFAVIEQKAP